MKAKFLESCYKVSSLTTCVLNEGDNPDWSYGATAQTQITDNLKAITRYEPVMSDYISPSDYEVHIFSIDFIRDGEFLHGFAYERKINKPVEGSLANPDLDLDKKLTILKQLQPGLRGKVQSLKTTSLLTPEEETALINKGEELQEQAERKLEAYHMAHEQEPVQTSEATYKK